MKIKISNLAITFPRLLQLSKPRESNLDNRYFISFKDQIQNLQMILLKTLLRSKKRYTDIL